LSSITVTREISEQISFADFCNTSYCLSREKDSLNQIILTFTTYGFDDLLKNGAKEMIEKKYAEYKPTLSKNDKGATVLKLTINYTFEKDSKAEVKKQKAEEISKKLSNIRMQIFMEPLARCMRYMEKKAPVPSEYKAEVKYRKDESYWLIPFQEGLQVFFGINFDNEDDIGICRCLLFVQQSTGIPRQQKKRRIQ
jgi:hypothetical protein